ncbi:DEKNAAC105638 [Brettanomyces naardenensis]|uniref:DEKNAAC105638 n=1 Tax=Brettanomyces naardenensis TaxID=13370 RepID=A0A448YU01_BRENA|nr:DEKNAAC105638 [Brettanomyces naardenensis]
MDCMYWAFTVTLMIYPILNTPVVEATEAFQSAYSVSRLETLKTDHALIFLI